MIKKLSDGRTPMTKNFSPDGRTPIPIKKNRWSRSDAYQKKPMVEPRYLSKKTDGRTTIPISKKPMVELRSSIQKTKFSDIQNLIPFMKQRWSKYEGNTDHRSPILFMDP